MALRRPEGAVEAAAAALRPLLMTALNIAPISPAAAGPSSAPAARTIQANSRDSGATSTSASAVLAPTSSESMEISRHGASPGGSSWTRIHEVRQAIIDAAANYDEHLLLALQYRMNALPNHPGESNDAAIVRLAVQLLDLAGPLLSARDALIELSRADWDLGEALNNWVPSIDDDVEKSNETSDGDNEGQPPSKRQRRGDDEEGERDGQGGGKKKSEGKSKGKEKAVD